MKTLSYDEQVDLTQRIIAVLAEWRITSADKIRLLALPGNTRNRAIQKYSEGTPLPFDNALRERVAHLLGIGHSLRLANPMNTQAGGLWLHRPHRRFNDRTPMAVMLEDGLDGIVDIRKEVDCSYDWYIDDQQSKKS